MIPKYRNRGIFQLISAAVLTAGFAVAISRLGRFNKSNDVWIAVAIGFYIGAYIMWTKAGFSFVRAKGYPRDHAGTMFLVLIIVGFCVPIAVFALPAIALFGLEDRSGKKKR